MLTATNIFVQYGDRVLLDHISVIIKNKDKVGLVGRNGAGKSTLLKILAREVSPMGGDITQPSNSTLAFLHQEIEIEQHRTVIDETMLAFSALKELNDQIDKMNEEIATRTDYESTDYYDLLEKFSTLNEQYAYLGGDSAEGDAVKVLQGLGFKQGDFSRKIEEFSGGWQMRIVLAKMLLKKPDYLLLDEPTNHLDIESIIWLEKFIQNYQSAAIIISHDQQFLDNCTKRTIEIELGRVQDYNAGYSKYLVLRKDRREKQMASFENQQKAIAQKERTISRFMAKATKTKMAQSMQKQLDKVERIEIEPEDVGAMNILFPPAPRSGQIVVDAKNIDKSYGDLEVLRNISLIVEREERVSFVGQNGQGKTTLAKIIVDKLNSSAGQVALGHNVTIGYYAQNQAETLGGTKTLLETMEDHSPPEMRTKLRGILGAFLFSGEDQEKKVSVLSGGERARLALACLLLNPFNLLVLDEPTNHLDILSKEVLKNALMKYDGTLIIVSHDRSFMADLTDRTIEFRDKQLFEYLGDINYFLQKRELDNLRQVEMHKTVDSSGGNGKGKKGKKNGKKNGQSTAPRPELSKEDQAKLKELEKSVKNAERRITNLETEIKTIEAQMAVDGFYEDPASANILEKYKSKKAELEDAFSKWEKSQEAYDTISQ